MGEEKEEGKQKRSPSPSKVPFLFKLPVIRSKKVGKLGPAIGVGAGCGVGLGIGLFGGSGIGVGFPGLYFGFGAGAGCGIGVGFGYGKGAGIAYDKIGKHSNMGNVVDEVDNFPECEEVPAIVDEIASDVKKLISTVAKSAADKQK